MNKSFILIGLFCINSIFAQQNPDRIFNVKDGLALRGYDPVSYFTDNKAILGTPEYKHEYLGVTYYFSSVKNQNLFEADPKKYEPQYGGWCAYALIKQPKKMDTNPKSFKIINGKLYLFYSSAFFKGVKKWNEGDQQEQIKLASKNYKLLK